MTLKKEHQHQPDSLPTITEVKANLPPVSQIAIDSFVETITQILVRVATSDSHEPPSQDAS